MKKRSRKENKGKKVERKKEKMLFFIYWDEKECFVCVQRQSGVQYLAFYVWDGY